MRLETPRIAPIHEDNWSDETRENMRQQHVQGEVANIWRTLANHEKLAKRWQVFGAHILSKSTLSTREREILILRTGWLCQAEYEWGQHVVIGKNAGLSDEEIAGIKEGSSTSFWSDHEKLLITAADELIGDAFMTTETWNGLAETYSEQQLMDVVFTCGQYNLVSMALNTFGVQLDDNISGF